MGVGANRGGAAPWPGSRRSRKEQVGIEGGVGEPVAQMTQSSHG